MEKYINLEEHFTLSDEEKRLRGDIPLLMSYKEEFVDAIRKEVALKYKLKTTYRKLVFGQLIIIEQILTSQLPEFMKIALCLSIFYRPISEDKFDNEDEEKEEEIKNHWITIPAGLALGLFDDLIKHREDFFYGQYNGVVYKKKDDKDALNEPEEDHKQPETYEDVFYRNFGWYERARNIAKELNMTLSEVNMMPTEEAMMELAYQLSKAKLTEYQEKNKKK